MIRKNHNDHTKEFFQKLLLFIDTIFVNATSSSQQDANKVLVDGILSVRDAIFSEIIKDSQIESFNQLIQSEQAKKNQSEEKEKNLNQEKELEKDQSQ